MKKSVTSKLLAILLVSILLAGCSKNPANKTQQDNQVPTAELPSPTVIVDASNTQPSESAITPTQAPTLEPTQAPIQTPSESPIAPEVNPPGDIPDSQVFITYSSTDGGYSLEIPEGWARTENGTDVSFADKFDGVSVNISDVSYDLSKQNIIDNYIPILQQNERAVTIDKTAEKKCKGGTAVVIDYSSNSEPDAVTNKQIRLEDQIAIFINSGKMAVIRMWAPKNADNVDQWNYMKDSFKWN